MKTRILLSLISVLLASCMAASSEMNPLTGLKKNNFLALGVDANKLKFGELEVDMLNMSNSLQFVVKKVSDVFRNYLIYKGFEFIGGKYYDQLGNELDSETQIAMEKLRNAHSIEEGNQAIKMMEAEMAAGGGA